MTTYEPISTEFKRGQFTYRQIVREGDWCIYEQTLPNCGAPSYEVIRIRRTEAGSMKNPKTGESIAFKAAERYPSSESWGADGFTYPTMEIAHARLRELCGGVAIPQAA